MSVSLMSDVWSLPAKPFEKLVLAVIADHVNESREDKTAWPSLSTITRKTGMTRATVCRIIRAIISQNWLTLVNKGGSPKGEKRSSNVYVLTIPTGIVRTPVLVSPQYQTGITTIPVLVSPQYPNQKEAESNRK